MNGNLGDEPLDLPEPDYPPFEEEPAGRSHVRALLGGAAAVAVLAGGAAGFLWLSTSPSADASALSVPGAISTPGVSTSPERSVNSAFGGRDIFASTVAPTADTSVIAPVSTGGAVVAATPGTGTLSAIVSAPASSSLVVTSGTPANGSAAGAGATTPSPRATPSPTGTTPSSPRPAAPTPTPTPWRSTAPAWQQPDIVYTGSDATGVVHTFLLGDESVNEGRAVTLSTGDVLPGTSTKVADGGTRSKERVMTDEEKAACRAKLAKLPASEAAVLRVATADCTVTTEDTPVVVFVPVRGADSGWIVPSGTHLPAAAVGSVSGTVRVLAVRQLTDQVELLVRVDRDRAVWLSEGEAVPGTPLTVGGVGLDDIERADVVWFTGAESVRYYTVPGAGEDAGVGF
ncbi:hypothetical protein [Kineococcus indalonis]|uniref:hypothetical protein n=1 Tax=Kineococcus indalonis TaxID=2696566 RepID=UPI00141201AC|nr:hypothetical protein [Kineococcus indalonis]NAZ84609.1 hypothetical protein [Kineococcus indalonis]